ncbi:MAG: membrane protein insertase YidC [Lachnospiraceae bacterium]|nr:membrane protein insertase YidC [Lachnospiraceae bacterium]
MEYLYRFLGWIMNGCYALLHQYGLAIILFTFISKIVILPVSLWTYFNSITMIKITPDSNFIKAKYYGQPDEIAEAQSKLFKEKKYHPMASTIPLIIQLILLMGVVGVIRQGIENPAIDMNFLGINLGMVPSKEGVRLLWSPLVAGFSAWLLCIAQNTSNVLQAEQSKLNKIGTMVFSVGLSLYLGWFVPIGTAFYWVCSNLLAIVQLYITNWIVRPRRFVDYERLEESRRQLALMKSAGGSKKKKESFFSPVRKKERADYKRFFSILNKHLVFYSESSGFYKYFKGMIEWLLKNTNLTIHYITGDPDDQVFELAKEQEKLKPYYIGENRLITLMMKLEADVVVMTMPDLETYHIKRSYSRKDIEYIYVQHGMGSNNMGMRKGSLDHFDTIFCAGEHQKTEVEQTEEVYGLKKKTLVEVGYPLIDEMRAAYEAKEHPEHERPKILIAPSWQKDNIIDSCLEQILDVLKGKGYEIIVRPHPQEVRLKRDYIESIKKRYDSDEIEIQTDFSSNNPVLEADLLITDWSGITWEYAFTTLHPVLFINTPMKVENPDYQKIAIEPLNITLRDQIGKSVDPDRPELVAKTVEELLAKQDEYHARIDALSDRYIYNHGTSAVVGAKYIVEAVRKKTSKRKQEPV